MGSFLFVYLDCTVLCSIIMTKINCIDIMKYRIIKEKEKFRAYIGKQNRFGGIDWNAIENDNCDLCHRTHYYETKEDAFNACVEHHSKNGYSKKEDIVEEFEL